MIMELTVLSQRKERSQFCNLYEVRGYPESRQVKDREQSTFTFTLLLKVKKWSQPSYDRRPQLGIILLSF